MSKIEKLIKRIESFPKNFTYQELKKLLNHFGYQEFHKGNTSGFRVCFYDKERDILIQQSKASSNY